MCCSPQEIARIFFSNYRCPVLPLGISAAAGMRTHSGQARPRPVTRCGADPWGGRRAGRRLSPARVAAPCPSLAGAVVPCAAGIHVQMPVAGGGGWSWKKRCEWGHRSWGDWAWVEVVGDGLGTGMCGLCWCPCSAPEPLATSACVAPGQQGQTSSRASWGAEADAEDTWDGFATTRSLSLEAREEERKGPAGSPFQGWRYPPRAKNMFIDSFIGKSPAGSCREGPLVSMWTLARAAGLGAARALDGGLLGMWQVCGQERGFPGPHSTLLQPIPLQDMFYLNLLKHHL